LRGKLARLEKAPSHDAFGNEHGFGLVLPGDSLDGNLVKLEKRLKADPDKVRN
jgi:hypothetical protein